MATIVYLDVDDEITSAATRLRDAGETRVALVLPFGSRLATSRMNFRLLSREAFTHGRRLAIVAPDGGTRALAASAGLPVFASVAEYEESDEAITRRGAAGTKPDEPAGGAATSIGSAATFNALPTDAEPRITSRASASSVASSTRSSRASSCASATASCRHASSSSACSPRCARSASSP